MNRLLSFCKAAALAAGMFLTTGFAATVERLETPYNTIEIQKDGSTVYMLFQVGRCSFVESARDLARPDTLPIEYTRSMTAALAYPERLGSILEIGVGGATTLSYLHRHLPETRLTGVDIDPGVIALAKKHFGAAEDKRLGFVVEDGRKHLATAPAKHDLILVDAYRGTWVPETLTTVEFFKLVKSRLAPGGAVAQNVEPSTLFFDGLAATLAAVFEHVDAYPTDAFPGAVSNTVLVAYDGPKKPRGALLTRAGALQAKYKFAHPLPALVDVGRPAAFDKKVAPLRDSREQANTLLMIDRANARNTPRERSEACR